MDPFLLRLVTPRLDVIFQRSGTVRPRIAQPTVSTGGLPLILLLLFSSLRLPLEGTSLAGADLLDVRFPSRVLLTCCRGEEQIWNTELLTTRANKA